MAATRSRGMAASGPFRSATKERNRAVLVAFRGTVPLPRPGRAGADGRVGRAARRPGATGHSSRTQARNPARVEAGARVRRSSHKISPPTIASGVASSAARVTSSSRCRARAQARTTPIEGVAGQGVGDRRHGPDGQVPPARRGRDRVHEHAGPDRGQVQRPGAGCARRPCRARATPRQAKTRAAASGIAASRAAMAGRWRVASTIRYWAVKLTAAAAAARTHSPAAALRSHRPERSLPGPAQPGWALAALPAPLDGDGQRRAAVSSGMQGSWDGLRGHGQSAGRCPARGCCHGVAIPFRREGRIA